MERMPAKIGKIAPTKDLGEYLKEIRDKHAAFGLGIPLKDPYEFGMLAERDLVKAGIIKTRSYKTEKKPGSILPKITRLTPHEDNLFYKILKIHPAKSSVRELLDDGGKKLIKVLSEVKAIDFRAAAYEEDDDLYLVVSSYDADGNEFSDEMIEKMSTCI